MFKKIAAAFGAAKHAVDDGKFMQEELMTQADYDFINFVSQHQKSYGTVAEFNFRKAQFAQAQAEINELNAENGTATYGHNFMSDWTHEEYKRLLGYKPAMKTTYEPMEYDASTIGESMNWVTKGAVTAVKNQGQCGSCWAFSSTGAIEGADQIAGGSLTSLSEQQLMDCSKAEGNQGCNGGLMDNAFKYVKQHPLETESEYPYKMKTTFRCEAKGTGVGHISGYSDVRTDNVEALKAALMNGPVSIAIEADKSVFQRYTGGVITSRTCGKHLDHGVLAVGFDTDSNGTPYFLVKNSWGASWGVDGYVKIGAESSNVCGILSAPSQPTA
jgi:C1A family cysteine protease